MVIPGDFLSLSPGSLLFSLVITGDLGSGAQRSAIDFAFQSTAWPFILEENGVSVGERAAC